MTALKLRTADGVFSGGGVKGLAFAGAVQATEDAGYVLDGQLAGTSAGAICALALAVGYRAAELRSLFDRDLSSISDPILGVLPNYLQHGWVKGKGLMAFIQSIIEGSARKPVTFGDLPPGKLRVIGTDLVHERMVIFPGDAGLYRDPATNRPFTPDTFPLALAVRISAGFPGYFPPMLLEDVTTGRDGALVDGGVCSSFPVWLFDKPRPEQPTWGFHLYGGLPATTNATVVPGSPLGGVLWPVNMLKDVVDTAIGALDHSAMKKFGNRIVAIPTGQVDTLNFALSARERQGLYDNGYQAARQFFAAQPVATNVYGDTPPKAA